VLGEVAGVADLLKTVEVVVAGGEGGRERLGVFGVCTGLGVAYVVEGEEAEIDGPVDGAAEVELLPVVAAGRAGGLAHVGHPLGVVVEQHVGVGAAIMPMLSLDA